MNSCDMWAFWVKMPHHFRKSIQLPCYARALLAHCVAFGLFLRGISHLVAVSHSQVYPLALHPFGPIKPLCCLERSPLESLEYDRTSHSGRACGFDDSGGRSTLLWVLTRSLASDRHSSGRCCIHHFVQHVTQKCIQVELESPSL